MTDSTAPTGMTQRHWIAMIALLNAFVAFYLHLYKLGLVGSLACTSGHGCEVAQFSSWGWFLGVDVALIGTIGYTLIFITAIVGTGEKWINDPRITIALMCLIFPALAFTVRLKRAEWFILKVFCPWCFISTVSITMSSIVVLFDWRRVRRG